VGSDSSFDLSEGVVELLDLSHTGVGEGGEESKSLIDCSGSFVVFSDLSFVFSVLLFSYEVGFG
jgi:hypothetical protein